MSDDNWIIDEEMAQKIIDTEPRKVTKPENISMNCNWTEEQWKEFRNKIIEQYGKN